MAFKPVDILIRAKDEASGVFSSMGSKVAAVGAAIAGYFGISAFVGAVKGAADLESKLSEVKAVSGATTAEMGLLRKAAEDAGKTTKFTATEAADALGNLARAGLSSKDAIAALPAVMQLAQAGGIGLAEASEYITKATMGMGLSFQDAGRVADVLAMGANASNTSVTGLAQALSYSAPLAKSLGLSLESTVAIIGKFADAGIDASRAGTALNAILSQFSDPASKFRQELAAAGITTNNFEQALRQMAAAGPAGNKAILAVGTEAGPALRALLNQGIGALDDLKGKLDGAEGSAAKTAAVMEGNLNGALGRLASAWDTVKNTLATPVLPVITDAVKELAEGLRAAVSNGTIGKFGEAIATAFQSGIKWAREFLGTVDFAALVARMQRFAEDSRDTFNKIGEYARNAGDIVKLAYGVMAAGVDAVLTGIYGLGAAFAAVASKVQNVLSLMAQGISKITFGAISESYKRTAADLKLSAEATWAASEALAAKAQKSFGAMGDAAQLAREGWDGLTDSGESASAQATAGSKAFDQVATSLTGVNDAALLAIDKAKAFGIAQKEAADKSKSAISALRAEYEADVAAGNWQGATEKLIALKKAGDEAKGSTAALSKQAEADAQAIADSFSRLGIKTKAELSAIADVAKKDFERVKQSGQATSEGLTDAFTAYAKAAIAANGGVATETLKIEAAMRGVTIAVDASGKATVANAEKSKKAIEEVARAYIPWGEAAEQAAEREIQAREKVIAAREKENDLIQRAIDLENKRRGVDAEGFSADKNGNRIVAGGDLTTLTGIAAFLKSAGVADEAKARDIAREFADSQGNVSSQNSYGQNKYGGAGSTISQALLKAAERYTFGVGAGGSSGAQQPSTIPNPSPVTVNVRITLPNGTTQVVPTTQNGSEALIAVLQSAKLSAGI